MLEWLTPKCLARNEGRQNEAMAADAVSTKSSRQKLWSDWMLERLTPKCLARNEGSQNEAMAADAVSTKEF